MEKRKKILVVDDRDNWLQTVGNILEDDYDLSLFREPAQAQAAFQEGDYDLVILDMKMPNESEGLELLKDLRESKPAIRAIILTEFADVETAVRSMKLGALDYVPKTEKNFYEVLRKTVAEALEAGRTFAPAEPPVCALMRRGESASLEFKSTLRWDMRKGELNKGLEKVVVKTVAAFMNAEGEGNLLIGVDDDGTVVGIRHDYVTLGKKDRDGFENLLVTLILDSCGKDCAPLITVHFHQVGEAEVCQVAVKPSTKPVFVRDGKDEHFYVRTGNATRQLNTREALEYCKLRWRAPA